MQRCSSLGLLCGSFFFFALTFSDLPKMPSSFVFMGARQHMAQEQPKSSATARSSPGRLSCLTRLKRVCPCCFRGKWQRNIQGLPGSYMAVPSAPWPGCLWSACVHSQRWRDVRITGWDLGWWDMAVCSLSLFYCRLWHGKWDGGFSKTSWSLSVTVLGGQSRLELFYWTEAAFWVRVLPV